MQHNSNTEFVMYVDNFLSIETLESLQETFINLKYSEVNDPHGRTYGKRHTFQATPRVGDIYLFPSWLSHMVYPFRTQNEERRSVSFNVQVKRKKDKDEQQI